MLNLQFILLRGCVGAGRCYIPLNSPMSVFPLKLIAPHAIEIPACLDVGFASAQNTNEMIAAEIEPLWSFLSADAPAKAEAGLTGG
jgi:hypothetical protein